MHQVSFDGDAGRRREEPMSYRELTMVDVREVLRRWQAHHSERSIARESGVNRKTVRRYTRYAEQLGLPRDRALSDAEIHEVAQCVQARSEPARSDARKELERYRERIAEWLKQERPLKLSKIHQLLQREGVQVNYTTLRRYVIAELQWHKPEPTILLDDPDPGQEAQVDFGKVGYLFNEQTQRVERLWVLIVTLSFSRYMFIWPTFKQTTEAVCEGLDRAWKFFGGMSKVIIPDNMKSIVVTADAFAPRLTEAFSDYAVARELFVDPARVRAPKDKARVENQVPYVRENWFEGESFVSLDDARRSAEQWCRHTAGERIHGTTRKVPHEQYETVERAHMKAAPTEPFDVPIWGKAKVHPDHHVQFLSALYSVPTVYLHKQVRLRADSQIVRIYLGTELVKTHPRQLKGGRSTDVNDYPVGKSQYATRSIDSVVARAKGRGANIGMMVERLVAGPLPWARMRQVYALLRLCDKYGDGRVEAVCQTALAFDVLDLHRIKRMVQLPRSGAAQNDEQGRPVHSNVVQLPLRFARSTEHFETRQVRREEGDGQ